MEAKVFAKVLKQHDLGYGTGVPCSFFKHLVNHMIDDPDMTYLHAASEGEAVAIAAGLCAGGRRSFALMQNSGLGNAVNPITSLLQIYDIPVLLFISQRGQPGLSDEPQHSLMGRITEELSRLMELHTEIFVEAAFAESLAQVLASGKAASWIFRKGAITSELKTRPPSPAFITREISRAGGRTFTGSVTREETLRKMLPLLNRSLEECPASAPAVICTTGKLSRELFELDDRRHDKKNRFYMVGSMGCAAGFGFGVARAQPQRKVVVLDGDGALLMKMGTLSTIGHYGPSNFLHVVFDNAAYESTGAQSTSSMSVDLAAVALACGYKYAETTDNPAAVSETMQHLLTQDGPGFLRIIIAPGSRADLGRPDLAPREGWLRFSSFLQER